MSRSIPRVPVGATVVVATRVGGLPEMIDDLIDWAPTIVPEAERLLHQVRLDEEIDLNIMESGE